MLGKPIYRHKQNVEFDLKDRTVHGKVYIIDKFGTFEKDDEVSYDIFSEEDNCLYKHIPESMVRSWKK